MKTVLLLIAALAGSFQGQAESGSSKHAPHHYVSQKFGLMIKVPSGLSFCPLPSEWAGSEEGTVLFLKPPSSCLDVKADSSTTRPTSGFTPSITIYYRGNVSKYDPFDGKIPASATSEELARQYCPDFFISPDLKLFDQHAVTCRFELHSNRVRIVLMSLYDSTNNALMISLLTTKDRLEADKRVLAKLSSSISACRTGSVKEKAGMPSCPVAAVW